MGAEGLSFVFAWPRFAGHPDHRRFSIYGRQPAHRRAKDFHRYLLRLASGPRAGEHLRRGAGAEPAVLWTSGTGARAGAGFAASASANEAAIVNLRKGVLAVVCSRVDRVRLACIAHCPWGRAGPVPVDPHPSPRADDRNACKSGKVEKLDIFTEVDQGSPDVLGRPFELSDWDAIPPHQREVLVPGGTAAPRLPVGMFGVDVGGDFERRGKKLSPEALRFCEWG